MAAEGLHVLLIEDNPGDARLFEEMLREAGELPQRADASVATGERLELHHWERLEAGLDHLEDSPTDVVLLDLDLPDSRGLETLEAVVESAPDLPVVVLTGLDDRDVGIAAIEHGAQDYLVKDEVTGDLLVRSIHYALERNRQERERERRREQLAALNRLNRIAQDVTHAVITTDTREELERAVCDRLAEEDGYRFAWIGAVDRGSGRVSTRAAAGAGAGYLDERSIVVDGEQPAGDPTARAAETHEVQVVQEIGAEPAAADAANSGADWRAAAAERSFRSVAAVPAVFEGLRYGVLTVYADAPDAFSGPEAEILGRLGDVIGHAISAIERRDALAGDAVQQLEFVVDGALSPLVDLSTERGATVRFGTVVRTDDGVLGYGRVGDTGPDPFLDAAEATGAVDDARVLSRDDAGFEVEVRASVAESLFDALAAHGGSLDEVVVDGGECRFTTAFAQGRDTRRLIELVQEHCPDATLRARRTARREDDGDHRTAVLEDDRLTEKQRVALQTAYHAGHFEWPRETTGEELAERLGISAATFHEHLRAAEKKLFDAAFDDGDDAVRGEGDE